MEKTIMYQINKHITKKLLNEYKGSEQKETLILDDGCQYLLKKPDPIREQDKKNILSYINNTFSEYIGCHIAKIIGLPVQETILGEYKTRDRQGKETKKIVCLCKDVRNPGEKMREFDTISLSTEDNKDSITFAKIESIISHIQERLDLSDEITQEIKDFYYQLFIFDAFIGNTDRHNGNIAILLDEKNNFSRISPIYDCGSCLLPLVADTEIENYPLQSAALSIHSVICKEDGNRIRYNDYLIQNRDKSVDQALQKIICKINLNKINDMIDSIEYICTERKEFYKNILQLRYDKILIPALEQSLKIPENSVIKRNSELQFDLYQIYLDNIKPIAQIEKFESIYLPQKELEFMRISKKYACCIQNNQCIGLLPIRSNHDAVREAIRFFQTQNIDLTKERLSFSYGGIKMQNVKYDSINQKDPVDEVEEYESDL